MVLIALLLTSLIAQGDIHRCVDAQGAVSFQGLPCADQQRAQHLRGAERESAADAERELRLWLESMRAPASPTAPSETVTATPAAQLPALQVVPTLDDIEPQRRHPPVSERLLAICSEQFLRCASAEAGKMDACIGALPACSAARASECCPAACIERYQHERRTGHSLRSAVHLALLDPLAPRCATP